MGRRLLIAIAALFAAALAAAQPPASAASAVLEDLPTPASAARQGDRFGDSLACPVTSGSLLGACPKPLLAMPQVPRPTLRFCASSLGYMPVVALHRHEQPSVCGTGFQAGAVVFIVINSRTGSTLWRVVADRAGGFYSPLPWALCQFAPGRLAAFDQHDRWAAGLRLPQSECP
jgi:hypothetical protein